MTRHLVIGILIITGFAWCSDQLYSDYKTCRKTKSSSSCYEYSIFNSWQDNDINMFTNRESLCRFKTQYIQLIYCKYNYRRQCLPDDRTKDLFVTAAAEEKGFLYICSRPEAIKINCLQLSSSENNECQKRKPGSLSINATFEEWKENYCRSLTVSYECLRDSRIMENCLESRSIYLEYIRIIYPKACGGHNGQPSIFTHLHSFSQLTLILIITYVYL